jgi:hypothetical protein
MANVFILSMPRAGSSMLSNLVCSAGYKSFTTPGSTLINASPLNAQGYFEDVTLTLLNDQLIKALYGMKHSFLYPQSIEKRKFSLASFKEGLSDYYYYDVDISNVLIPKDFVLNVEKYTGQNWDVWGITRMINDGKWQNCYKKHFVSTKLALLNTKSKIEQVLQNSNRVVIKDPRLTLTLELFQFLENDNNLFIYLRRSPIDTIGSMRRHYGPNLFTKNTIVENKYVSNHFNHKVEAMEWDRFNISYDFIIDKLPPQRALTVDYESIVNRKPNCINDIESFIGGKLDLSLIKS